MSENFFKEMKIKYEGKFTYLENTYEGVHKPFTFICPTHGKVITSPNQHRKIGCKHCNRDKEINQYLQEFTEKANNLHNNKYDYSEVVFKTNRKPVTIICPEHGKFQQTTSNHLKGHGCKKCQYEKLADSLKKPKSQFIQECNILHNNFYTYEKANYVNTNSKITITCPLHGDFVQWAGHHVRGVGCPKCSYGGFNKEKPGILYYLSINNGECFKIGITNLSVNERYSTEELDKITILDEVFYNVGQEAYDKEQAILAFYNNYKYTLGKPLKSGNTELFSVDIRTLKENNEITSIRELKT